MICIIFCDLILSNSFYSMQLTYGLHFHTIKENAMKAKSPLTNNSMITVVCSSLFIGVSQCTLFTQGMEINLLYFKNSKLCSSSVLFVNVEHPSNQRYPIHFGGVTKGHVYGYLSDLKFVIAQKAGNPGQLTLYYPYLEQLYTPEKSN